MDTRVLVMHNVVLLSSCEVQSFHNCRTVDIVIGRVGRFDESMPHEVHDTEEDVTLGEMVGGREGLASSGLKGLQGRGGGLPFYNPPPPFESFVPQSALLRYVASLFVAFVELIRT